MSNRERLLAAALEEIRSNAVEAAQAAGAGNARLEEVVEAFEAIAEDAAEALADLPVCYSVAG